LGESQIHESVELLWAMASKEACLAGSARIEPIHFLLAALIIIDGLFEDAADALDFSKESVGSIFKLAGKCRSLMKMTDDEVTLARRGIRKSIRQNTEAVELEMLHRSPESRFMFQRAYRRAHNDGVNEVDLYYVFAEVLESMPEEARVFFPYGSKADASDDWPDYIGGVS
jgi:hypothetical protein